MDDTWDKIGVEVKTLGIKLRTIQCGKHGGVLLDGLSMCGENLEKLQ